MYNLVHPAVIQIILFNKPRPYMNMHFMIAYIKIYLFNMEYLHADKHISDQFAG